MVNQIGSAWNVDVIPQICVEYWRVFALIVAGLAAERGVRITFIKYLKIGFPLMIITIIISTVYVYLRYLM